jgi:hypothetical protein
MDKVLKYSDSKQMVSVRFYSALRAKTKKKLNSMVCVRERTIPTERPPLIGEVIANFCG